MSESSSDPITEDEAYALAVDEAEAADDLDEATEVQRRLETAAEDF
ncbi:hypothetical protein Xcel_0224 [Xylanimonas cellulosilytica DSM 15894]|uniref:Uncharacterized protein n=1 Tax=Xylanimonas cellulosilytica (strain DSM 15894 / JCM 12276 / CECT 5975 / KCTC 9989 / LMG 20990 / NBRC 107835 / XIL07) TaxID=446471 RepID=D1BUM2_XYLCX|nr:hypothetical protein [Xylanimonas cellulosilytica]ACZ29263.1 hypothetical protein Xcel_0224 [Xylanimonas cellulosilytica DSM 15894]